MDDITRAMLGDHDAAARLTERGVAIPCPSCAGADIKSMYVCGEFGYGCSDCGTMAEWHSSEKTALADWNRRAPLLTPGQMEMLDVMESRAESEALNGKRFGQAKPYWEYREPRVINCEKLERERGRHEETAEKAQDHGGAMEDQMF